MPQVRHNRITLKRIWYLVSQIILYLGPLLQCTPHSAVSHSLIICPFDVTVYTPWQYLPLWPTCTPQYPLGPKYSTHHICPFDLSVPHSIPWTLSTPHSLPISINFIYLNSTVSLGPQVLRTVWQYLSILFTWNSAVSLGPQVLHTVWQYLSILFTWTPRYPLGPQVLHTAWQYLSILFTWTPQYPLGPKYSTHSLAMSVHFHSKRCTITLLSPYIKKWKITKNINFNQIHAYFFIVIRKEPGKIVELNKIYYNVNFQCSPNNEVSKFKM
jgi:hypothetical protein